MKINEMVLNFINTAAVQKVGPSFAPLFWSHFQEIPTFWKPLREPLNRFQQQRVNGGLPAHLM